MKNDLQHLKETLQRKEGDQSQILQQNKQSEEKLKKHKNRSKQLDKELAEMRTTHSKMEHEVRALQQQLMVAATKASATATNNAVVSEGMIVVDEKKMEALRKEVGDMKLERVYLQNQLSAS